MFQNNPSVRLLTPANNELGRTILEKTHVNLRNSLHLYQWKTCKKQSIGLKALTVKFYHV